METWIGSGLTFKRRGVFLHALNPSQTEEHIWGPFPSQAEAMSFLGKFARGQKQCYSFLKYRQFSHIRNEAHFETGPDGESHLKSQENRPRTIKHRGGTK